MPWSPSKAEQDLATLNSTVSSILTLLTKLQSSPSPTSVKSNSNNKPATSDSDINPLALAHDAASLIKAHTTKLSLLIITPPFTASALISILRALTTGPLPGLASSLTLCAPSSHTYILTSELHYRVTRLASALATLVAAIPLDGRVLKNEEKDGGRGSLTGTGAVWDACNEVMGLKTLGVAGVCVRKVESYREFVKDALEELREWGAQEGDDEDEEEDDDEEGSGDEEEGGDSAQDIVDSIFNTPHHIPSSDPDRIRPRLDVTLRRLRLLILLYTSLIKRRFKSLPPVLDASMIGSIDSELGILKEIPDMVDELASAFYDLEPEEIDARMRECFEMGTEAAKKMERNWKGGEDEFTAWAGKFKSTMGESR